MFLTLLPVYKNLLCNISIIQRLSLEESYTLYSFTKHIYNMLIYTFEKVPTIYTNKLQCVTMKE